MNGLCQSLGWVVKAVKDRLEVAGVGGDSQVSKRQRSEG